MDGEILHEGRLEAAKVLGPQQMNEKGYDYVDPLQFSRISDKNRYIGAHALCEFVKKGRPE